MKYVTGTPSAEESTQMWKLTDAHPPITGDDYEAATMSLEKHIARRYALSSFDEPGDCYIRGDFFGDSTQYLELYYPELLASHFVSHLQTWLRAYDGGSWRIVIPTYIDDESAVMVYPEVVRLAARYGTDLDAAYARITRMMRERDTMKTYHSSPVSRWS